MNSDEKRLLRHFESYDHSTTIHSYYTPTRLWDRVVQPGTLVSLVLLAVLLYHRFSSENPRLPPLPDLLWTTLVRITPARLLYALDGWLHPPLFPLPMLQTQTRSTSHAAKSEVLRRVLGMDKPGGIMASVSQAGRRSLSGLSVAPPALFKGGDADRPPGLGNISNSCYQNSVLQGLASLRPLRAYLAAVEKETAGGATPQKDTATVDTLRQLVRDLNDPCNNGRTLWTPSVLKSMSTWQQQDAQEYFSKLLDSIDREMARVLPPAVPKPTGFAVEPSFLPSPSSSLSSSSTGKDDTAASQHSDDSGYQSLSAHCHSSSKSAADHHHPRPLRNPLEGLQAQRVACTACGHSAGLTLIPFNCLTLNLGADKPGQAYDLADRLDSYTRVEPIAGVDCPKCTLLKYRRLVGRLVAGALAKTKAAGDTTDAQAAAEAERRWPEPFARLRAIEEALEREVWDDEEGDEEAARIRKACAIRPEHRVAATKTKQAVVARAPASLAVHVNRSVFDERDGRMWKNPAAVRFPAVLDLGPWCLGSGGGGGAGGEEGVERWVLDPLESMVAGARGASRIVGPVYELRAVITHYGRHENGHYVCYRKYARRREEEGEKEGVERDGGEEDVQWWRLSDQDVTKVDEQTVLAQGGVFMLFYDCVDPSSTLVAETEQFVDSVSLQGGDAAPDEGSKAREAVGQPGTSGQHETSGQPPSEVESTTAALAAQDEKPARAEMVERAKGFFARDMERAALVALPDEDDHL